MFFEVLFEYLIYATQGPFPVTENRDLRTDRTHRTGDRQPEPSRAPRPAVPRATDGRGARQADWSECRGDLASFAGAASCTSCRRREGRAVRDLPSRGPSGG